MRTTTVRDILAAANPVPDGSLSTPGIETAGFQLLAAIMEEPRSTSRAQPRRRRSRPDGMRWGRAPLISLAVAVAVAGAAFASGIIHFGAPAPKVGFFTAPRTGDGALTPGSVRMLPVSTPDPAGGAPWGIREFATSRGLGCVQVGRLAAGRLVALGQDYAFGNDGEVHELRVDSGGAGFGDLCSSLDRNRRLFLNGTWGAQPASAWQSHCYAPDTPATGQAKGEPECPQQDERNLYFGLLGPDAQSVTYRLEGHTKTLKTSGPEGAYLIVTRSTRGQLYKGVGTGGVVPVGGPIREIHYRDGAVCHLTTKSWIGGAFACTPSLQVPVGYVAPKDLSYTHPEVATPVTVRRIPTRRGYELHLSVRSRVPLTNANSGYQIMWSVPGATNENHGTYRTESDIRAGQTISTTTCPLPAGRITGTVSLFEPDETYAKKSEVVYAYKYEKVGVLVGTFTAHIPSGPTRPESSKDFESPYASCGHAVVRPRG